MTEELQVALGPEQRLAPAATHIATIVGPGEGRRALDVASGTGSVARALDRVGWQVSALDIDPALVVEGSRRAEADGVVIDWHVGAFEHIPFDDDHVDLLASSFGLIFAEDPHRAIVESHRVLKPGGLLALTAWSTAGFMADSAELLGSLAPRPPRDADPFQWGEPSTVRSWLAEHFTSVETALWHASWRFGSAREATDFLFEASPGHAAALTASPDADATRRAVEQHLETSHATGAAVSMDVDYLTTTARAR